jgi:hypothetical protein
LQFAPQVGDIDNNLNRADAVLSKANLKDVDFLVLPELAFSGTFQLVQSLRPVGKLVYYYWQDISCWEISFTNPSLLLVLKFRS